MNVQGMELLLGIENTEGATFWCRDSNRNWKTIGFQEARLNHQSRHLKANKRSHAFVNRLRDVVRRCFLSKR